MSSICSVVVADGNRDAADTLVELLRIMGYPATAACDGREASQGGAFDFRLAKPARRDQVSDLLAKAVGPAAGSAIDASNAMDPTGQR